MGKDWYWVGGRSGNKPAISSSRKAYTEEGKDRVTSSSIRSNNSQRTGTTIASRKAYADEGKDKVTSSRTRSNNSQRTGTNITSGCMNALFHFLDFRFPLQRHQPSSSFKPNIDFLTQEPKGLVAPRNSLELMDHDSLPMAFKENTKSAPMGLQIKTNAGFTRSKLGSLTMDSPCSSSEISNSPTIKTPSLVARLMGLDILPDNDLNHSQPSLQKPKPNRTAHRSSVDSKNTGTRSLPESPRISSARRSDFDYHHRLSLQLNKENNKSEVQSRSSKDYAREIVNQVKERVSNRRFGLEITNTTNNREQKSLRNHLEEIRKDSTLLCSPKTRKLEHKTKWSIDDKIISSSQSKIGQNFQLSNPYPKPAIVSEPRAIIVSAKPRLQLLREENPQRQQRNELRSIKGFKKAPGQARFGSRPLKHSQTSDIVRNKQEEIFVRPSRRNKTKKENSSDNKFSKTPISNDLIKISVASPMPVKRIPPNSATKARQKQVPETLEPASNSQSQSMHKSTIIGEREYVIEILRHLSINEEDIPVSSLWWRSLPRLLDPSIFETLENLEVNTRRPPDQLSLRCNRKLLFELVDENLIHVLEPAKTIGVTRIAKRRRDFSGSQLIDALCARIRSFPSANCRVLEDIDELVARDFPAEETAVEVEAERMAAGIERDIFHDLVVETVSLISAGLEKRNGGVCSVEAKDGNAVGLIL